MNHRTPAATVGVVGGGQLGRMLGEAAGPLGVELVVSDPTPDCPATPVVREQVVGDFDDEAAIRKLAERADVLTFEIELADPDAMARIGEATDTPVHPDPGTLRTIQDKLVQNRALEEGGVPVPGFRRVDDAADLRSAAEDFGWPLMLKAREGGYDGRGNRPVEGPEEADCSMAAASTGSSCSRRTTAISWSTRSHHGPTTPGTGRSRGRSVRSSNSTSGPCWGGRWAARNRARPR